MTSENVFLDMLERKRFSASRNPLRVQDRTSSFIAEQSSFSLKGSGKISSSGLDMTKPAQAQFFSVFTVLYKIVSAVHSQQHCCGSLAVLF